MQSLAGQGKGGESVIIKEFKKRKDILARHCKKKKYTKKYVKYHFKVVTDFLFFCKKKERMRKLSQISKETIEKYITNLNLKEKTKKEHSRIIKKFCELYSIQI